MNESERDISLNVPTVSDGQALTTAPRKKIINVFSDGRILLDEQSVTLEQLHGQLSSATSQYQKLGVVIRGDAASRYQNVADVIATCRQANISDLNISVRVAQQTQGTTSR